MKHIFSLAAFVIFLTGCKSEVFPEAPTKIVPSTPISPKNSPVNTDSTEDSNSPIHIVSLDRTSANERPVELSSKLQNLATASAKKAGLKVNKEGQLAGVEFHYGIVQDDKIIANAQRGLLTWTVMVTLRIEDDMGLAEDLQGTNYGESPYVRDALPDLEKALLHLLGQSARRAFLDVRMQREYRNYPAELALKGLDSREPEENWAAMRRLGELKHVQAVPKIISLLEVNEGMTAEIAMGVLARIKAPQAVEPLAKAAESSEPARALGAIQALLTIGTDPAINHVKRLSRKHSSLEVRSRINKLIEK